MFNLKSTDNNNIQDQHHQQQQQHKFSNDYQLWLKTNSNEPLIPLIGKLNI